MASNAGEVMSPATNFDSWIELYNPGDQDINLSGMYLSNDADSLKRWRMPSDIGTVPAKGFLVVWLGYKKLIMIRKANPEIARGEYEALSFPGTKLGGFTAAYGGSTVCVLHNTTLNEITVDVGALGFSEIRAVAGLGDAALDGGALTLASQTSVVLR